MRKNYINDLILVVILYITPISLLFTPIINPLYFRLSLLIILIFTVLIINRFKFPIKFLVIYCIIILLLSLNLLMVTYKPYVLADAINMLLLIFVPFYILMLNRNSLKRIIHIWRTFSVIFSLLIPVYYLYMSEGYLNYMDIGFLSHINIIILLISFHKITKNKLFTLVLILINLFIGLVFGSRMLIVATIIIIVYSVYFLNKKGIKQYIVLFISTILFVITFLKLNDILDYLIYKLESLNLSSRNLALFSSQLKNNTSTEVYLSGRDGIYTTVIEHLKGNGIFPSGLSVIRHLTNDTYYHAHSFYFEILIVFGVIIASILLLIALIQFSKVLIYERNSLKSTLLIVMTISFLIRSITGTYFINDSLFVLIVAILITAPKKTDFQEHKKT